MAKLLLIGEEDICSLLKDFLKQKMFMVDCAASSKDAYKALNKDEFDLILYDFRIQDADGLSLISQLRALKPNTPLILLSNNPDLSTFMQAVREGAVDCISDPLNSNSLLSSVYQALAGQRDSSPKTGTAPLSLKESAHRAELAVILGVLEEAKHNRTKAAQILNIDRKTLYNKLKLMDLPQDGGDGSLSGNGSLFKAGSFSKDGKQGQ